MSRSYIGIAVFLVTLATGPSAQADNNASRQLFDRGALTEDGMRALIDAAAWLRLNPKGEIVLEGASDPAGRKRGYAARDMLLSLGVMPDQIVALPLGQPMPFIYPFQPVPPQRTVQLTAGNATRHAASPSRRRAASPARRASSSSVRAPGAPRSAGI